MEEDEDTRPTPRRYQFDTYGARTPNDYNRGVQNATEAGVADNRRVLNDIEEARAVQRRELAEELLHEFSETLPSISSEPLKRGSKDGDAYEQVVQRIKAAVDDQRAEIRELRETIADLERVRLAAKHEDTDRSASVVANLQKELHALREQSVQDEEMIRYLQECRSREAQVIVDWKKDILLWLKRNTQDGQYYSSSSLELPSYIRRPRRAPLPGHHRRQYVVDEDEFDDLESFYAPAPRRSLSTASAWRAHEERLIDILEQGERVYDKIMETSAVIKRKLGQ